MSSSGLVPFPSSKRDENEYGPSNAPLPSFMFPLPCLSVPSHTAVPVRVAMILSPLCVVDYGSRQMRTCAISFCAVTHCTMRTVMLSGAKHLWLLRCLDCP